MAHYKIELDREEDGSGWLADCPDLPGSLVQRQTRRSAILGCMALALSIEKGRMDKGELPPDHPVATFWVEEPA